MNEPTAGSTRIEQLDEIAAMLDAKLIVLDQLPSFESEPTASTRIVEAVTAALPTNPARELVESVETDLTKLAQEWASWREQLQQWEHTLTEA